MTTLNLCDLVGIDYRARAWSPTIEQARRPAAEGGGADCWGLTRLALQRIGIELPPTPADAAALLKAQWQDAVGLPRMGDVWLIEHDDGVKIEQHLGVVIEDRTVLHTTPNVGSRVQTCAALQRFYGVKGKYRHVAKGGV